MRTLSTAISVAAAGALALGLASLPLTAADAGSTWRVTIRSNTEQVVAGHKIVLTGHVRPIAAAAGQRVRLQEKFKPTAPWKTRNSAKVTRIGTYRLVTRPTTGFTHRYRVLMPAVAHHQRGVSPIVKVKVYAWSPLIEQASVNNDHMGFGSVNINGTTYDESVALAYDTSGSIEFNVNRDCTRLRGTFGLSDDSTAGGQGELSVAADDGAPVYTKTFEVGQSETTGLAFATAPLKLRLETHSTSTAVGTAGLGAFGSPEVLCSH
jgi:hypothetical protein